MSTVMTVVRLTLSAFLIIALSLDPVAFGQTDGIPPVFTNCPTETIETQELKFKWTIPSARDESSSVTVRQVSGPTRGTALSFGTQVIRYEARDAAANTQICSFAVHLKAVNCSQPTSSDPDIKMVCNGLSPESICQLKCKSGSFVRGGQFIRCYPDASTGENKSVWKPYGGPEGKCFKSECKALPAPKNGALICDTELGGVLCQLQCDETKDVSPGQGMTVTFICGIQSKVWTFGGNVPDCTQAHNPPAFYLPTKTYYYYGNCETNRTNKEITDQFTKNLASLHIITTAEHTKVTCGVIVASTNPWGTRKRSFQALGRSFARGRPMRRPTCPIGQVLTNNGCVPCPVGFYKHELTKSCQPCAMGSYQNASGAITCNICPEGQTTSFFGSTSVGDCIEMCRPHSFSTTGRQPCRNCPSGTFQPNYGGKTCLSCDSLADRSTQPRCMVASVNVSSSPDDITEFLLQCHEGCLSFD